eukprot:8682037-Karenia_brevis.AAC.1
MLWHMGLGSHNMHCRRVQRVSDSTVRLPAECIVLWLGPSLTKAHFKETSTCQWYRTTWDHRMSLAHWLACNLAGAKMLHDGLQE